MQLNYRSHDVVTWLTFKYALFVSCIQIKKSSQYLNQIKSKESIFQFFNFWKQKSSFFILKVKLKQFIWTYTQIKVQTKKSRSVKVKRSQFEIITVIVRDLRWKHFKCGKQAWFCKKWQFSTFTYVYVKSAIVINIFIYAIILFRGCNFSV